MKKLSKRHKYILWYTITQKYRKNVYVFEYFKMYLLILKEFKYVSLGTREFVRVSIHYNLWLFSNFYFVNIINFDSTCCMLLWYLLLYSAKKIDGHFITVLLKLIITGGIFKIVNIWIHFSMIDLDKAIMYSFAR